MKSESVRRHLTYSNVMATIAVFAVLGGGAYAATKIPKNSVGAKQLKKNAVTTAKLKNGAVTSAKVRKGSLLAANFKSGQLPRGATGPKGATGAIGPAATAMTAGGGDDAPSLLLATTNLLQVTSEITITEKSDILVWGTMGDEAVQCSLDGCEGTAESDSTNVGLYLLFPEATSPLPVPESGVTVQGGALTNQMIPPMSGVMRDVDPGTYQVQLIVSSFGIGTSTVQNGGGFPRVFAIASAAD